MLLNTLHQFYRLVSLVSSDTLFYFRFVKVDVTTEDCSYLKILFVHVRIMEH